MNFVAILCVFIAASSYGILSSIVKMAYGHGYTFAQMTGLQLFMGTLFLWVVLLMFVPRKIKKNLPKSRTDWWGIFLLGLTTAGTSILYYKSVEYLPASIAVLLLMQFSWMNIILEWIFFKSKPSLQAVLATLVIIVGTVLASGALSSDAQLSPAGIIYGLGAGLSYATFLLSNGRYMANTPSLYKSGFMAVIASVIFICIFPPTWVNASLFQDEQLLLWGGIIGFFGVVVPPLLLGYGMPKVGVVAGSIISTAELPVALVAAVVIASETITTTQWLGAVIILIGILASKLRKRNLKPVNS